MGQCRQNPWLIREWKEERIAEGQREKKWKERLKTDYEICMRTLQTKLPPDLIDQASEIAAAELAYQKLRENRCSKEFMDYLLQFKNPLEMVRDLYGQKQDPFHTEGSFHPFWHRTDKGPGIGEKECQDRGQEVTMC